MIISTQSQIIDSLAVEIKFIKLSSVIYAINNKTCQKTIKIDVIIYKWINQREK